MESQILAMEDGRDYVTEFLYDTDEKTNVTKT